jgi:hypothetical protein
MIIRLPTIDFSLTRIGESLVYRYLIATDNDDDEETRKQLEREAIKFHERQAQEARQRLSEKEPTPSQESDPPRNGASSFRTA